MAKKKINKSAPKKKAAKKVVSKKGKSKSASKKVSSSSVSGKGRKKKSVRLPNPYNVVRQAISEHYEKYANRRATKNEVSRIYYYIKQNFEGQSLRYVVLNIDVIIENHFQEFCRQNPVDLSRYARSFEWFYLKDFLYEEQGLHIETDIIRVDLSSIGIGVFEFAFDKFASKSDEIYRLCKGAGLKQDSPPPYFVLQNGYCDFQLKANVFIYKLLLDGDSLVGMLSPQGTTDVLTPVTSPISPVSPILPVSPQSGTSEGVGAVKTPLGVNYEFELEKERLRIESEERIRVKNEKMRELNQLLKDKVITFQEYLEALKAI